MRVGQRALRISPQSRKEIRPTPQTWVPLLLASVRVAASLPHQNPAMLSPFAWVPADPEAMGAWEGAHPGEWLTGCQAPDFWTGTRADQTAAEIPGGTGPADGCSESLPSASALSPLPIPQLPSRLLVLSLVTGQWCWGWQSQQIHRAGDAGRLEPSVHESAQLWCSCQWETKQRHLEYVPQGPSIRRGEGGP